MSAGTTRWRHRQGSQPVSPQRPLRSSVRPRLTAFEPADAEAAWVDKFEKRVPLLTDTSALDLRDFGGDSREEELYRLTSPFVKQEEEGKFRCKTCSKLFSARKFVEKHIGLKHPEVVGDALDRVRMERVTSFAERSR